MSQTCPASAHAIYITLIHGIVSSSCRGTHQLITEVDLNRTTWGLNKKPPCSGSLGNFPLLYGISRNPKAICDTVSINFHFYKHLFSWLQKKYQDMNHDYHTRSHHPRLGHQGKVTNTYWDDSTPLRLNNNYEATRDWFTKVYNMAYRLSVCVSASRKLMVLPDADPFGTWRNVSVSDSLEGKWEDRQNKAECTMRVPGMWVLAQCGGIISSLHT